MRRILRVVAVLVLTSVVVPASTAGVVLASFLFLPLPAILPEPNRGVDAQISRIFDKDGNQIGVFRRFDTTKPVRPEDIPLVLKQAVIASEDRRFYEHGGVDVQGTLRALWADIRNRAIVQGGSTITQQYVKNAYTGGERSITRKIREAILASQLDRQMDKEEILFKYLSQVYFGEGAYGVGAASETYFRKPVQQLTISEAATLAGIIPAPSRYHPRANLELTEQRRRLVLDAMLRDGHIDMAQHQAETAATLWYAALGPPPAGQPTTIVFPRETVETTFPYFVDYVERYLASRYGPDAVYTKGLQIYTTLDRTLQAEAEAAVRETLSGTAPPLEMSLVSVEPPTGYVRALVGGRDFYAPSGQVNLALGAGGGGLGRQPGSSFKPFVLATALEKGISPDKRYSGANGICFGGSPPYCPQNYGGSSYGTVSLRTATAKSINTVYVALMRDVGGPETFDIARRLGVSTANWSDQFGLASALGTIEVSPLDMASAYGVFAARGERAEPTPVVRVLDADGQVLEDNAEPDRQRVIKEVTADTMNDVMRHVFDPGSTANGRDIGRPAAGKTGTTQDSADAWFVGYTPTLSTAVWMGYRDSRKSMTNIKGVRAVTGGSHPARTWQAFMRKALQDVPVTDFNEPAPIVPEVRQSQREERGGFNTGRRRFPEQTEVGGGFVQDLPPPTATMPTTTTTTTTPRPTTTTSTSTTTTTTPFFGDADEDDETPGLGTDTTP